MHQTEYFRRKRHNKTERPTCTIPIPPALAALDASLLLRTAAYCDPRALSRLHQTSRWLKKSVHTGVCLPRALVRTIGIDASTPALLRADANMMRHYLHNEPEWVTELWEAISEALCRDRCSVRHGAYRRPGIGRVPRVLTLAEAKCPRTWAGEEAGGYRVRAVLRHEVFRITRLHARMWYRHAPTGMALIY